VSTLSTADAQGMGERRTVSATAGRSGVLTRTVRIPFRLASWRRVPRLGISSFVARWLVGNEGSS
jgi:hypothetical protein